MNKQSQQRFGFELKVIADRLSKCEHVNRHDTPTDKQAWTLAHTFLDLAESFETFMHKQLPRLGEEGLTSAELHELLVDIGEEFRHILYHLNHAEFYAYLRDEAAPAAR